MTPSRQNSIAEEGKFRLVKFFAYASFIILVIFSFPFSVVISQMAKDILVKSYENYALLHGENLNHQVFQNFSVPVYRRFGVIRLSEKEQYEWMDKVVRSTIHSFNIDLVNIYDIGKGVIAYSTDNKLIGKEVNRTVGYVQAIKGRHSSGLITKEDDLWGLGIERIESVRKLRTYIPFRGVDPFTGDKGHVLGVFELIQDLSEEYKPIVKLQYFIFGLSIMITALIFIALLLIVHKAEKTISKRESEQRELEAQLNQAERLAALGKMIAGVSHEIRNPLGIIQSTAELLADMPDSSAAQKKLSSVIIEESSRLNNTVTEFMDFARPQEPNYQECYLDEIINKNLDVLAPELKKSKITVSHNINGRSLKLRADANLLYRTLLNIFINAIQSMPGGGTIKALVKEKRGEYVLSIEDSGSGIRQEDITSVFDPFFSTKDEGSGLGLSIVRNIIEGHNGSINIESRTKGLVQGEGSGTKVIITLPKA
ncbi:PAS domain-containing sensor histidine kinase [Thermodesulfobacteriota bacterium]